MLSPCARSISGVWRTDASSSIGTSSTPSTFSPRSAPWRPLAGRERMADPSSQQHEDHPMPVGKLFAIGLPIALGVVMIGAGAVNSVGPKSVRDSFVRWGYPAGLHRVTGGLEAIAGLLLLIPATSRAGAIGCVVILTAAVITLIRHRDCGHLPGAVVLTAVAVAGGGRDFNLAAGVEPFAQWRPNLRA